MQVLENLYSGVHANAAQHYLSFFSTELGGIVTDPVLMVVHMDDHLVHRGHAVFDTAIIVDGFLYQLEEHLARFQLSAELAGLALPMTIEQIRRVILETAAASREVNGEDSDAGVHASAFASVCCKAVLAHQVAAQSPSFAVRLYISKDRGPHM